MIYQNKPASWQDLQKKVGDILHKCGFNVEIEYKTKAVRGNVEIDVYAVENIDGRKNSIICECKYWKSNIPQNVIYGFRAILSDLGSNVGYIITTSNFQKGSYDTSDFTNVQLLTWDVFQDLFFKTWYSKYFYPALDQIDFEYNWVDWYSELSKEDKFHYNGLRNKLTDLEKIRDYFPHPILEVLNLSLVELPKLPLKHFYKFSKYEPSSIPTNILNESGFQEFLIQYLEYKLILEDEFLKLHKKYSNNPLNKRGYYENESD